MVLLGLPGCCGVLLTETLCKQGYAGSFSLLMVGPGAGNWVLPRWGLESGGL